MNINNLTDVVLQPERCRFFYCLMLEENLSAVNWMSRMTKLEKDFYVGDQNVLQFRL